ncbi:MAG: zinc-binding metallopeptidase family protein [Burkholderiaceae bacterium]
MPPATARRGAASAPPTVPTARRAFRCRCGRPVFSRNDVCLACGTPLGYDPELVLLRPLAPTRDPAVWRAMRTRGVGSTAPLHTYRRCANWTSAAPCNWLLRDDAAAKEQPFCRSCRLDRTVPDPTDRDNAALWLKVEVAKRALVSQLIALGLPVASRVSEDPQRGVMFDLLRSPPEGPRVMTGHADGLITLDIEEADDVHRERVRAEMHEPYRTLIGHLRHEIGHYYWLRLVAGTPIEEPCRAVFGDERADYAAALQRHYAEGAPPDWRDRHVSAYASAHPAEDWAETWAHYLHMVDVLDTARSFGLVAHHNEVQYEPFGIDVLDTPDGRATPEDTAFLALVNGWIELTGALNELTRSMGEPDFYPFVLSRPAVRKLRFIHRVVQEAGGRADVRGAAQAAAVAAAAAASTGQTEAGGCDLGGSPTGAGGVAIGDGSPTGAGGGEDGTGAGGAGGVAGGSPVSGGTGTLPAGETTTMPLAGQMHTMSPPASSEAPTNSPPPGSAATGNGAGTDTPGGTAAGPAGDSQGTAGAGAAGPVASGAVIAQAPAGAAPWSSSTAP